MDLISNNPYRVAGILSNSTAKELQRQKSKISKYASIGRQVDSDYDFPFLSEVDRSEPAIHKAFSAIEQNQGKVIHALFWFLKGNTFDEIAIAHLTNGDREKAIGIWERVTADKEITSYNFSCFNNLGTLNLLSGVKEEVQKGIESKIELIESDGFIDFIHLVADETYSIAPSREAEMLVDKLTTDLKKRFSDSETLQLFGNCNGTTQKYLKQKFTAEPIHQIESSIESTKNKRKGNQSDAYTLGLELFTNCKKNLELLRSLLGASDLKYKMIADQLANEIMQCGIDYFNRYQGVKDPSEESLKLIGIAEGIGLGEKLKTRLNSNKEAIEEFYNRDINEIIFILEQIANSYKSVGYSILTGKTTTINVHKVDEILKNNITSEIVKKIASSSKEEMVKEFFNLIDYVFKKMGRTNYTYNIANIFADSLPTESKTKDSAVVLSLKLKPTIGSNLTYFAKIVDSKTNGKLGDLTIAAFVILIGMLIVWIISLFG